MKSKPVGYDTKINARENCALRTYDMDPINKNANAVALVAEVASRSPDETVD
jgi:hypothetical protein